MTRKWKKMWKSFSTPNWFFTMEEDWCNISRVWYLDLQ